MTYLLRCVDEYLKATQEYCTQTTAHNRYMQCFSIAGNVATKQEFECLNPQPAYTQSFKVYEVFCLFFHWWQGGWLRHDYVIAINPAPAALYSWRVCVDVETNGIIVGTPFGFVKKTRSKHGVSWHGGYQSRSALFGCAGTLAKNVNFISCMKNWHSRFAPVDVRFGITTIFGNAADLAPASFLCIHTYAIVFETCPQNSVIERVRFMFCVDAITYAATTKECPYPATTHKIAYIQHAMICRDKYGNLIEQKCPKIELRPAGADFIRCWDTDRGTLTDHQCVPPASSSAVLNTELTTKICRTASNALWYEICQNGVAISARQQCWDTTTGLSSPQECGITRKSTALVIEPIDLACRSVDNYVLAETCFKTQPLNQVLKCIDLASGITSTTMCLNATQKALLPHIDNHHFLCIDRNVTMTTEQCRVLGPLSRFDGCWNMNTGASSTQECLAPNKGISNPINFGQKNFVCLKEGGVLEGQSCSASKGLSQYKKCWNTHTGLELNTECANAPKTVQLDTLPHTFVCVTNTFEYKVESCYNPVAGNRYIKCSDVATGNSTTNECPTTAQTINLIQPPERETILLLMPDYSIQLETCRSLVPLNRGGAAWNFFTGQQILKECASAISSHTINPPRVAVEVLTCYDIHGNSYLKACRSGSTYSWLQALASDDACFNAQHQGTQCPTITNNLNIQPAKSTVCQLHIRTQRQLLEVTQVSDCPGRLVCREIAGPQHTHECSQRFGANSLSYSVQCSKEKDYLVCQSDIPGYANLPTAYASHAQELPRTTYRLGLIRHSFDTAADGRITTLSMVMDCTDKAMGYSETSQMKIHSIPYQLVNMCVEKDDDGLYEINGIKKTEDEIHADNGNNIYYAPTYHLQSVSDGEFEDFVFKATRMHDIYIEQPKAIESGASRAVGFLSAPGRMVSSVYNYLGGR